MRLPPHRKDNNRKRALGICNNCGEEKSLTEFYRRGREAERKYAAADPRRYRPDCKVCARNRTVQRRHNPKLPRKVQKRVSTYASPAARKKAQRTRARLYAIRHLADHGCAHCGNHDPRVLDHDHIDPSKKKHTISWLLCSGYSWTGKIVQRELAKCRILCANCHRIHTAEQQDYYSDPEVRSALALIHEDFDIK